VRRLWRVQSGRLARLYRLTSRADFLAAVAALVGVLVLDTLPGLVVGIVISLVLLIARTSRPRVAVLVRVGTDERHVWVDAARHPGEELPSDVLVVRVEAPLFFANADYVRDQVRARVISLRDAGNAQRLVVMDGRATPSVDVTAASMLVQLKADLDRLGTPLVLAGDVGQVRDVLAEAAPGGEPPIYTDIDEAIASHSRETGEGDGADPPDSEGDPAVHPPDAR
jgi:SulP family sulfate permease